MSTNTQTDSRKVTTHRLIEMKQRNEKIAMLTAYDFSMARLIDEAGIDVILVGDSASNVMAGNITTLPITLDQMIYHGKSVVRAVNRALVVVDMPFGSYQGDPIEALHSAIRIMKETHADCVKLEGGSEVRESIEKILSAGIPVIGIGAGGGVDGQVLVMHDMLGINKGFSPRFLRRYADLSTVINDAVSHYISDVKECDFPNEKEQY